MSSESEKPLSARDRILQVAGPLFWAEGYRAIGVDRVIAESGVAKATFYKHFPSKDDLIVAWINRADAMSAGFLPPSDAPDALSGYLRRMIAVARADSCLGCTFQGSAAEFRDPAHPAHAASLAVKRRVLADLQARARAEGLPDPMAAGQAAFLFMEGIWAAARMFGPGAAPLDGAEAAVLRLIGANVA